ncbi:MAG: GNAT family N-acetyltransferase [Chloroflexales bacterium]|nr:GNAT family N-acetyltransferase [Chloroflexales bacterium]
MPQLIAPDATYRDSYIAAIEEFQAEGRHLEADLAQLRAGFAGFVAQQRQLAEPAHVPIGHMPQSDYWLIEGERFLGRFSLRHALNEWLHTFGGHVGYEIRPSARRHGFGTTILRLGLAQARALGLRRVLVTCDSTNEASRKIIAANGGAFENAVALEGRPYQRLRYWIDLPA